MSSPEKHRWMKRLRTAAICVLASLVLLSQIGLSELQLGDFSFAAPAAPHITRGPTMLRTAVRSRGFVRAIGGIAFDGVAVGKDGLSISALAYAANADDGSRLIVTVENPAGISTSAVADLPDWQLVPIAKFAASDNPSCMTLFGDLNNKFEQLLRKSRGQRILNYHEAFQDTLLGLRLMQADILIFEPNACDLPADNGIYLLGTGENPPDVPRNSAAFESIHTLQTLLSERDGGPYTSYVICDVEQSTEFSVEDGNLVVSGQPYWHCWRQDNERMREIIDQAVADVVQMMLEDIQNNSAGAVNNPWTEEKMGVELGARVDELAGDDTIIHMDDYSRDLSLALQHLQINPEVYSALTHTMRYAAVFRNFRQKSPEAYAAFVASLDQVAYQPITTPTVLISPVPNGSEALFNSDTPSTESDGSAIPLTP